MAQNLRPVRVFLASPGDVTEERGIALQVLQRLSEDVFLHDRVAFKAVAYDHPDRKVAFVSGMPAQDAVTRTLGSPAECDIVVVILWSRLGSPIEQERYRKPDGLGYYTGTEWEFEVALRGGDDGQTGDVTARPTVLLYRCSRDVNETVDPERLLDDDYNEEVKTRGRQKKMVKAFFEKQLERTGELPNDYSEPHEFKELLEQHLKAEVKRILDSAQERHSAGTDDGTSPTPSTSAIRVSGSPYPGLRPHTVCDEMIFFGRGRETDELVKKVKAGDRFVAVLGASGSGKSSLVWAGLIPRLLAGVLEDREFVQWFRFTPGGEFKDPFKELVGCFKPILDRHGLSLAQEAADLREDPAVLKRLIELVLQGQPPSAEIILFIDQFEEVFTLITDEADRLAFMELIATTAACSRVRIVLTLRADFYSRCLRYQRFTTLLRGGSYPLPAPQRDALRKMIELPAASAGLTLAPGLVDRILDDTGAEPGGLALMAFALEALYQKRCGTQLTMSSYEEFGGVREAIGRRANDIFEQLPEPAQERLKEVFRELLKVDGDGRATRRRAPKASVTQSESAELLVDAFVDGGLLVTNKSDSHGPVVEVAHEALFESWSRLTKWIRTTAGDHRLRRQIEEQAEEWERKGRSEVYRWPDERIGEVLAMCERLALEVSDFTERVSEFLGPLTINQMQSALEDRSTEHEQRQRIGIRLLQVDSMRPGVGLRDDGLPDIQWCWVPWGNVTVKTERGDLTEEVDPFFIAKYPLTYRQYRVFLEAADGFKNPAWWLDLPVGKRERPSRQVHPRRNYPADNIAWDEALAYCRWLSSRYGVTISVPTEWQWQQAATGGDPDRLYPWGKVWDPRCANTFESGVGWATAVGLYPSGASLVGALDMAGNVWEWCLNEYDDPRNVSLSSKGERVVRGGAWFNQSHEVQTSFRTKYTPYDKFRIAGFGVRVTCATLPE